MGIEDDAPPAPEPMRLPALQLMGSQQEQIKLPLTSTTDFDKLHNMDTVEVMNPGVPFA